MTNEEKLKRITMQVASAMIAIEFVDATRTHDYDKMKRMFQGVLDDISKTILKGTEYEDKL